MPQQTYIGVPSAAGLDGEIAAIVIRLLRDAGRDIGGDGPAAMACLNRASALLESERSRAAHQSAVARRGELLPTLAPWQARRVASFVTENIAGPIRLADLAGLTGLPALRFVRAFRASFGMEVHEYVALRRLNLACVSMLTTDETLGQIAEAAGLHDEAQFAAAFEETFGERPEIWRRARRGFVGRGCDGRRDAHHGRDL